MIWGAFSDSVCRAGLFYLPKSVTMNAVRYIDVLKDHLVDLFDIHGYTHFMQDGAACYKAKKVMEFLTSKNIEVLQWPGN